MRNMLQRGRIVLSWLLMGGMVLTFAGIVAPVLPQWQVLPALLAGNLLVIAVIIVLTLLLGRIYCSVLCPLGISQDFVFWLAKRRKKNRRKFTFRRERRIVRYSILMLTGLAFLAGLSGFVGLVDPYSIFGRIVHDGLGLPVAYGWNALVGVNESHGWIPVLSKTDILWPPLAAMALAGVYFVVLTVLAWRYGRAYCHTVCPVGTLLGTLSRFSLFRPVIDGSRCIHCGACEKTCRSSCIDVAHGFVDTSRCVDCFDCVAVCPKGALTFSRTLPVKLPEKKLSGEGISRREMLLTTAVAAGTIAAGLARSQTVVPALMGTGKGRRKSCRLGPFQPMLLLSAVRPAISVSAAVPAASWCRPSWRTAPCRWASPTWIFLKATVSITATFVLKPARPVPSVRWSWP